MSLFIEIHRNPQVNGIYNQIKQVRIFSHTNSNVLYYHQFTTILKAPHSIVTNINHLIIMQCSAVKSFGPGEC